MDVKQQQQKLWDYVQYKNFGIVWEGKFLSYNQIDMVSMDTTCILKLTQRKEFSFYHLTLTKHTLICLSIGTP